MAYDKATQQVILFGDRQSSRTSETWAWTAAAGWTRLTPATSPPDTLVIPPMYAVANTPRPTKSVKASKVTLPWK
jgi:hypothetical protein